jgi:hypothetical protein
MIITKQDIMMLQMGYASIVANSTADDRFRREALARANELSALLEQAEDFKLHFKSKKKICLHCGNKI